MGKKNARSIVEPTVPGIQFHPLSEEKHPQLGFLILCRALDLFPGGPLLQGESVSGEGIRIPGKTTRNSLLLDHQPGTVKLNARHRSRR